MYFRSALNVSLPLRKTGQQERSWLKRAWCLLDEQPDGLLTWAPFARVIIAKAKELGGQGVTFRRTLPRYVSKTSNISRPAEHPEKMIRLPTLRPLPPFCRGIIGASPRQHGFLLRINGRRAARIGIPSKDYSDWQAWRIRTMCGISKNTTVRIIAGERNILNEPMNHDSVRAIQFSGKLRAPVGRCKHVLPNTY